MKISEFKSGNYITQTEYKSFMPAKINCEWQVDQPELQTILEEAHLKLGWVTWKIWHPVSDFAYPVSRITHPVSHIAYLASRILEIAQVKADV